MTVDELTNYLRTILPDGAMRGVFKANHAELVDLFRDLIALDVPVAEWKPTPLPPVDEITAAQVAIFDNWQDGKRTKGHPNRYGMALEVWTQPPDAIVMKKRGKNAQTANVCLMDATALGKQIANLEDPKRKNPISASYAANLRMVQSQLKPGLLAGLINSRDRQEGGTYYHQNQFVLASVGGPKPWATIFVNDDALELEAFSDRQFDGSALIGGAILQCRLDRCGFSTGYFDGWATKPRKSDDLAA